MIEFFIWLYRVFRPYDLTADLTKVQERLVAQSERNRKAIRATQEQVANMQAHVADMSVDNMRMADASDALSKAI